MNKTHRKVLRHRAVGLRASCLAALVALGIIAAHAAPLPAGPDQNPYLARSYNNQTHWNDAATDSTPFAMPRGAFEVTPGSVDLIPNESGSLPLVADRVRGTDVYWWWSGFGLRKIVSEDDKLVEVARVDLPVKLPDFRPVTPAERRGQAKAVQGYLDARDEQGLLNYMKSQPNRMLTSGEDQLANGAVYSLLTSDDRFFGCSGRQIFRIDQENPKDPRSAMKAPRTLVLPDNLFDNARARRGTRIPVDVLLGMGMTYNGYLVLNTLGGKVITVNRDTLEVMDVYSVAGSDELFLNSFATGPEAGGGAVYVASNTTMYRLVVDKAGKLHSDAASGAWQSPYERGVRMPAPKLADGTGSTPTLMGFGAKQDKLVVITDGASKMNLVAFWRDGIPAGWKQKPGAMSPRIADQIQVDMGPGLKVVQSEQSVAAFGDYAFVVNNMANDDTPQLHGTHQYVSMLTGATRPGPTGVATFKWDQKAHGWKAQWVRPDVSSISVVPMISGAGHMAVTDGYFAGKWNDRYYIGMDLDTGKTVMTIRTGSDPIFNGMYAPVKIDPKGRLFYGAAFGLVRLDTTKMKQVGPVTSAVQGTAGR
ncbi:conserved exported hypothetical protein [Cupriavidus necator]|uniref:Uncharacterized protein n=1 Tax=Cupriavidus necator TaxID=106590 RepID=A0A1K0IMK4_CUPNE|nr:conserved exported hypothetical protein [Cupriavidus necator]